MEILLDTGNLEDIKKYSRIYNIVGVTTNPTIVSREHTEFFPLLYKIKEIIGNGQLHVQVTADTWEEMVKEAKCVLGQIDKDVYIKVPTTEIGVRAMKELKQKGVHVTATAIYTPQQAMVAASVGADYVAPYFNRMNNLNVDSAKAVADIARLYDIHSQPTKILTASFKNTQQIMEAMMAGSHAVTVPAELLTDMVKNAIIDFAVEGFHKDWVDTYGDKKIYELL
ncbi:MAG: fructose-6-phosphate aldolase [Lachnospiraceae bacterium]